MKLLSHVLNAVMAAADLVVYVLLHCCSLHVLLHTLLLPALHALLPFTLMLQLLLHVLLYFCCHCCCIPCVVMAFGCCCTFCCCHPMSFCKCCQPLLHSLMQPLHVLLQLLLLVLLCCYPHVMLVTLFLVIAAFLVLHWHLLVQLLF